MSAASYSIHVNKRHIKAAFLLSRSDTKAKDIFDIIFDYNYQKWGGRFNPIIFTSGGSILDNEWNFLHDYDPDFIETFSKLNKKTLQKIDDFLSPIHVKHGSNRIDLYIDPISITPSFKNIKQVPYHSDDSKLVIFDLARSTPGYIRKFLKYNFGLINKDLSTLNQLDEKNIKIFKIRSIEDLQSFLDEAGEYRNNLVFPLQLSSINSVLQSPEYDYESEKFEVVVGDTIEELVHFWNRKFFDQNWLRAEMTCMWLSKKLADHEDITDSLTKFINKYASRRRNNNNNGVIFSSLSLHANSLRSVKNRLGHKLRVPHKERKINEFQAPIYENYGYHITSRSAMDFYRAQGEVEKISLNEPDIEEGTMLGQHWMADLHIQFRPERFSNYLGKEFWWQLPNRNILASQMTPNRASRIRRTGVLSALMKRSSTRFNGENESLLELNLLSDERIIRLLCFQRFSPYFNGDARKNKVVERTKLEVGVSSNGRNLNGLISLFGGLSSAYNTFSTRYWRTVFDQFSKKEKIFNDKQKEIIGNKCKKSPDKAIRHIFSLIEGVLNNEKSVNFKHFKEEANKELKEYNKKVKQNYKLNVEKLMGGIQDLLERQVLIMGISPTCSSCGINNWYPVDKIKGEVTCEGCSSIFSLKTEEEWYYKLNSLVKNCYSFQGLAPVILVLGELLDFCKSCFLFTASLNVYKIRGNNPLTDLDIVCVQDGKFIIGEIKESNSGFEEKDFKKMRQIARQIRPDEIIFSSLDKNPTDSIKKKMESLAEDLSDLGITVKWFSLLRDINDPSPNFY